MQLYTFFLQYNSLTSSNFIAVCNRLSVAGIMLFTLEEEVTAVFQKRT